MYENNRSDRPRRRESGRLLSARDLQPHAAMLAPVLAVSAMLALGMGCATVTTTTPDTEPKNEVTVNGSYTGEKRRVQIVRFGLPDSVAQLYPELREKRVGWGMCNRLVDALYETNRFTLVEEKHAVLQKIMETWALGQSGAVSEETAPEVGGLTAPQFLVYAEVYDFAVGTSESVMGVVSKGTETTRIGVQVRLVDVQTSEYTPASGIGEAAVVKGRVLWAPSTEQFDQSTVGKASGLAVNTAVNKLVKRLQW